MWRNCWCMSQHCLVSVTRSSSPKKEERVLIINFTTGSKLYITEIMLLLHTSCARLHQIIQLHLWNVCCSAWSDEIHNIKASSFCKGSEPSQSPCLSLQTVLLSAMKPTECFIDLPTLRGNALGSRNKKAYSTVLSSLPPMCSWKLPTTSLSQLSLL